MRSMGRRSTLDEVVHEPLTLLPQLDTLRLMPRSAVWWIAAGEAEDERPLTGQHSSAPCARRRPRCCRACGHRLSHRVSHQRGFLGVDVFFVLSGYLITSLLVGERMRSEHRPRTLLGAPRSPPVSRAVAARRECGRGDRPPRPSRDYAARPISLSTLFYVANLSLHQRRPVVLRAVPGRLSVGAHVVLSIEEQFYLAWPLLVLGLTCAARRRQSVLLIATGLAALASAA